MQNHVMNCCVQRHVDRVRDILMRRIILSIDANAEMLEFCSTLRADGAGIERRDVNSLPGFPMPWIYVRTLCSGVDTRNASLVLVGKELSIMCVVVVRRLINVFWSYSALAFGLRATH